jgi:hypothetical protein
VDFTVSVCVSDCLSRQRSFFQLVCLSRALVLSCSRARVLSCSLSIFHIQSISFSPLVVSFFSLPRHTHHFTHKHTHTHTHVHIYTHTFTCTHKMHCTQYMYTYVYHHNQRVSPDGSNKVYSGRTRTHACAVDRQNLLHRSE